MTSEAGVTPAFNGGSSPRRNLERGQAARAKCIAPRCQRRMAANCSDDFNGHGRFSNTVGNCRRPFFPRPGREPRACAAPAGSCRTPPLRLLRGVLHVHAVVVMMVVVVVPVADDDLAMMMVVVPADDDLRVVMVVVMVVVLRQPHT